MVGTRHSQVFPYFVQCEDFYAGYRIPAGFTVYANSWSDAIKYTRDLNRFGGVEFIGLFCMTRP